MTPRRAERPFALTTRLPLRPRALPGAGAARSAPRLTVALPVVLTVVLPVALGVALSGCSGSDESGAPKTPAPSRPATPAAPASPVQLTSSCEEADGAAAVGENDMLQASVTLTSTLRENATIRVSATWHPVGGRPVSQVQQFDVAPQEVAQVDLSVPVDASVAAQLRKAAPGKACEAAVELVP